ncbi:oxidoreductase [Plantactinospora sp. BC1]|uniref:SDR family NAD(P)-dependent oxidoreductase n=1 Tax=Plantactinospora sp. BC1 TaxID=2108470 RepID=UPI000D16FE57|nr:SDR family NAD(P)-dependent oxidoreductase [Plantactinospora sp. BC1]AVT29397.1 oxidoreductase [Plantactinospora sp. BC1]
MARIVTPFGRHSTAEEVVAGIDLSGRRAIVTGGVSGIGLETARALAGAGAQVTVTARDDNAGQVAADIAASTGNPDVRVVPLELTSVSSIRTFVDAWDGPLHILVNNAGIMALPELRRTSQGWEEQFAVNHLGHYLLAVGLRDALARAEGARIVSVSSSAHHLSPVIFQDIHYLSRPYHPQQAYGQAKTAVALFAVAAGSRWARLGITANALNPGAIPTGLQQYIGGDLGVPVELQKSPQQGAATSVLLATSPLLSGVTGRYFNDCAEATPVAIQPTDQAELASSVADYAIDPERADRLWRMCDRMVG